ncbi:MAG: MarR family transcriptional regulator [Myxococcales bacterium]|nr:MAG: MarR family transcriptional regulator [Myxococcales bacterium]
MKPAYMGVLWVLWIEDGIKSNELGRKAGLEPSTMTSLLDRMERDGLVERRDDPHDRRVQNIFLTTDGRAIKEPVLATMNDAMSRLFGDLPQKDLERMMGVLRKLLEKDKEGIAP